MKLMKSLKSVAIATCMIAITASAAFAQEITLKLGHLANEQNAWHLAAVKFSEELNALTDGRISSK